MYFEEQCIKAYYICTLKYNVSRHIDMYFEEHCIEASLICTLINVSRPIDMYFVSSKHIDINFEEHCITLICTSKYNVSIGLLICTLRNKVSRHINRYFEEQCIKAY